MKPRLVVDVTASARLFRAGRAEVSFGAGVGERLQPPLPSNFGYPLRGTHFGAPRPFRVDLPASFR